jgi:hypothetical protein
MTGLACRPRRRSGDLVSPLRVGPLVAVLQPPKGRPRPADLDRGWAILAYNLDTLAIHTT